MRDFTALVALFSCAITGRAIVTTATAAAMNAANHAVERLLLKETLRGCGSTPAWDTRRSHRET
jgi:hypothetical protein